MVKRAAMTKSAKQNMVANNDETKPTVGEELFLVHLSRFAREERDPNDFDREAIHTVTGKTVGEELWEIHCKRMQGLDDEEDTEDYLAKTEHVVPISMSTSERHPRIKRKTKTPIKHPRRIMQLRSGRGVRVSLD